MDLSLLYGVAHMIDMCIANAWLLGCRINSESQYMPLFDFKLAVSQHMRKVGKVGSLAKKRGRPATVLRTLTSSRADTPTSRVGTPSGPPDVPVPAKPRKPPAKHQDLPLDSIRADNIFPSGQKTIDNYIKPA